MLSRKSKSDNIISIELVNFPYAEDKSIGFKTDTYDNSFGINDIRCYFTKYLIKHEDLLYNPFEIVFLLLNGLPFDLEESMLFNYFKKTPSYIYLKYIDTGTKHKYMLKFNNTGILSENLFVINEQEGGLNKEININESSNSYQSSLPLINGHWFSRLSYYSYMNINSETLRSQTYELYLEMHQNNKELWSDYENVLVDLLSHRFEISSIKISDHNIVKIYKNQDSEFYYLEELDEHFINTFLLMGIVLKTLSIEQGILFMSECDLFDEYVIRMLFQLFNSNTTNDLGSQLIYTGDEKISNKIITLDQNQIDYITKK